MTTGRSQPTTPPPCAEFEARLADWLEGALDDAGRLAMERHHADCRACAGLVAGLDSIVQEARTLPVLTPSRDLWASIEARLEAPVIPLASRGAPTGAHATATATSTAPTAAPFDERSRTARTGGMQVRWFAVAATVLVAVSSAVTWRIARMPAATGAASTVASTPAASTRPDSVRRTDVAPSSTPAISSPGSVVATTIDSGAAPIVPGPQSVTGVNRAAPVAARGSVTRVRNDADYENVGAVYEREIASLRRIVDQRFAELDTATVNELRRNIGIIDKAILDSRRALRRDPRSGLLSEQLDRTLEAKLELLRRVALL